MKKSKIIKIGGLILAGACLITIGWNNKDGLFIATGIFLIVVAVGEAGSK